MQNYRLRNDLRESYDRHAQERESSTMQAWKIAERSSFLSALQKENKKKLLEIGAGTGRDSKYFQDQGFEVVCIDFSPAMIELCKQKGLTAYVMDMDNLEFPENSFDAVYSMNSLLHLTKKEFPEILHRINTLLKVDGMVYVGVYGGYDHEGIWDNDSYIPRRFFSFFSDENLEAEVSKVFDILAFNRVSLGVDDPIHFQSLILRKRSSQEDAG
jgi:cyclopropane fatty-acyl-phospholipid synthase-like methyltransferase